MLKARKNKPPKMDKPFITCLLTSHNKPKTIVESIDSLLKQKYTNWQCLLIDSGFLYDQGFYNIKDKRIELIRSTETEDVRKKTIVPSWCWNKAINDGLVKGEFLVYLCDDDIFYPQAFKAYFDYWVEHPEVLAMYGHADMRGYRDNGADAFAPYELLADSVRGTCCGGGVMTCRVDGSQICHAVSLLERMGTKEYWPENRTFIRTADGIFMDKIGAMTPFYPVNVKVSQNRKFSNSINDGARCR
jgi:glycosyltransferase involved in cell wall biosynthesis